MVEIAGSLELGVVLGLRCHMQAFSSCRGRGYSLVVVHQLLIAVASLVTKHGL